MPPNPTINANCNEFPILNSMGDLRPAEPIPSVPEIHIPGPPAVQVINACKSYSNGVPVLQNLDITVPQASIYGLLGSSGCGKTTILSCIVGIRKLDSGDIFVFGERPGTPESGIPGRRLGYMPQDTALYKQLSIKEMLQYFGRIYSMTHTEIMSRIEFLSTFLDLPSVTRRIGDLSGGQMRRVSLCVSLLHLPSLLILDEPTVGVDPLLRETIWSYLCDLAKNGTTIIVTTHYIEEARQANTIGILRNGSLLVEKSPDSLLREYNTSLLEDIVLKLCKKDVTGFGESHNEDVRQALAENSFYSRKKNNKNDALKPEKKKTGKVVGLKFEQKPMDENQNSNEIKEAVKKEVPQRVVARRKSSIKEVSEGVWKQSNRIRALAIRNALSLIRSPLFMLAIFFMPSFQVIITNLTLGPEPKHLEFGIVDPEVNFDLSKCEASSKKCATDKLSCQYIKSLPSDIIIPVSVASREEALHQVQIGNLWGYMEFPKNYSKYLVERAATNHFADNETIKGSTISVRLDQSHYFAAVLLMKNMYESFQTFIKGTLSDCDQDPQKANLPLNFRTPIYGTFDVSFHDYIGPAVLTVIMFFIPYLSCAVYNITDRKQGTLDRSMVAGITWHDLLAAFFCTEGFLIVMQTAIAYLLVIFIFQMDIKGPVIGFLLITVMTGLAGLSLGFLIAQLVEEEVEALILGVGFYLPNLIFCGIIWPLEAAPWFIRYISYCLPMTWAIHAIRSIISRGWSMTHRYVWPGYAVLILWIVGTWLLAAFFFKRRTK